MLTRVGEVGHRNLLLPSPACLMFLHLAVLQRVLEVGLQQVHEAALAVC